MTAEEFESLSADEAEAVLAERYTRLTSVGYSPTSALAMACRIELDLDEATQLIGQGQSELSVCRALLRD
jgi:hypothetical protein